MPYDLIYMHNIRQFSGPWANRHPKCIDVESVRSTLGSLSKDIDNLEVAEGFESDQKAVSKAVDGLDLADTDEYVKMSEAIDEQLSKSTVAVCNALVTLQKFEDEKLTREDLRMLMEEAIAELEFALPTSRSLRDLRTSGELPPLVKDFVMKARIDSIHMEYDILQGQMARHNYRSLVDFNGVNIKFSGDMMELTYSTEREGPCVLSIYKDSLKLDYRRGKRQFMKEAELKAYFEDWMRPTPMELEAYTMMEGKTFDITPLTKLLDCKQRREGRYSA